jgi:hypothetical protein
VIHERTNLQFFWKSTTIAKHKNDVARTSTLEMLCNKDSTEQARAASKILRSMAEDPCGLPCLMLHDRIGSSC